MNANLCWQMFCCSWISEETRKLSYWVENSSTLFVHVYHKDARDCIHDNTSTCSLLEPQCWMRPEFGHVEKPVLDLLREVK